MFESRVKGILPNRSVNPNIIINEPQDEEEIEIGLGIKSVTGKDARVYSDRVIQDLSKLTNPNAALEPNTSIDGLDISAISLVNASGLVNFSANMKQIAVFNPTLRIIKIAFSGNLSTNVYDFIVNPNKLVVFPPINFDFVSWLQETYTAGSVNPTLIAYKCGILAPSVSSIT